MGEVIEYSYMYKNNFIRRLVNILYLNKFCLYYLYKYKNNFIRKRVIILYYINTIDDMQNEKDFFYHYNEFVYIQGFEIFF